MRYVTAHIWEKGQREINEDSVAILNLALNNKSMLLAVVADGIGGMEKGEVAASEITLRLKLAFEKAVTKYGKIKGIAYFKNHLLKEIYCCHKRILEYGKKEGIKLGTTCSLICLMDKKGFLIHLGDSRIYKRRGESLKLLTKDDVNLEGQLTKCVGAGKYRGIYYKKVKLKANEEFLICTDGFYKNNGDNKTAVWVRLE